MKPVVTKGPPPPPHDTGGIINYGPSRVEILVVLGIGFLIVCLSLAAIACALFK